MHRYRLGRWKAIFDTQAYKKYFAGFTEKHVTRTIETTEQGVVDRVMSKSYIADLPDERRQKLEQEVREAIRGADSKSWIDKEKGIFGGCSRNESSAASR